MRHDGVERMEHEKRLSVRLTSHSAALLERQGEAGHLITCVSDAFYRLLSFVLLSRQNLCFSISSLAPSVLFTERVQLSGRDMDGTWDKAVVQNSATTVMWARQRDIGVMCVSIVSYAAETLRYKSPTGVYEVSLPHLCLFYFVHSAFKDYQF